MPTQFAVARILRLMRSTHKKGLAMLYQVYQTYADLMHPACCLADMVSNTLAENPRLAGCEPMLATRAACEVRGRLRLE